MLIGSAVHSIDPKGRVVIPAKYRSDLGSTVYVTSGAGGCIRAYSETEFLKVLDKLRAGNAQMNILRRKILASAEQLNIDAQGRILIPESLRKAAGITDKMRMVGMIDWLEFWNEETMEKGEEELTPEQELALMAELGLA
ncbi:MAG: division/cell wall cluster transcriptional repressor MraZ [Acutalibacteraceae bacterium]|nr:cell division/cell wall cluster transcriptional repressor MraZ [Bacillota bacterium]